MSTLVATNLQVGSDGTATNNFTIYQPTVPDGTLRIGNGNSGSATSRVAITSAGDVGIGTSSPGTKLDVSGVIRGNAGLRSITPSGTQSDLLLQQTGFAAWTMYNPASSTDLRWFNGSDRMTLDASGNLGIGTSSPAGKLSVNVDASTELVTFRSSGGRQIWAHEPGGNARPLTIKAQTLTYADDTATRLTITSGGDLYVGDTTNALGDTRLYVKGNGTAPASRIWANTSTTSVYGLVIRHESTTDGAYIQFVTNTNVETGRIYDSAGTMQYASSSDARLKTNVQPIKNGLQSVLALNPCTFDMRRGKDTFIPSAGLIAQEVHEIYPFAVGVGGDDENTNPWSVDYGKLTPLLVKAIQEQQAIIEELRARLTAAGI